VFMRVRATALARLFGAKYTQKVCSGMPAHTWFLAIDLDWCKGKTANSD
jgi:hypothetical protein